MGRGLISGGGLSEGSLNPDLKEVRGEGVGHIKWGPGIRSSKSQGPDPGKTWPVLGKARVVGWTQVSKEGKRTQNEAGQPK